MKDVVTPDSVVINLAVKPVIKSVSGPALIDYFPALARLRIEIFRDFPYLYDGTLEYEEKYLRTYSECPEAVIVLALDNDRVVGASTAIPMRYETDAFKRPLQENGYDIDRVFYCGESVLQKDYRGKGLGWRFFEAREAHAQALGGFDYSCFCAVDRPVDHPRRPAQYTPLDSLWQKRGYAKHPELVAHYCWKDLDESDETEKPMIYWIKKFI